MRFIENHQPSSAVLVVVLAVALLVGGLEFFIIFALGVGVAATAQLIDTYGVRGDP